MHPLLRQPGRGHAPTPLCDFFEWDGAGPWKGTKTVNPYIHTSGATVNTTAHHLTSPIITRLSRRMLSLRALGRLYRGPCAIF